MKSSSSVPASCTLSTGPAFGMDISNSVMVNGIVALPLTCCPLKLAVTVHVASLVTPCTARLPESWNVALPEVGNGEGKPLTWAGVNTAFGYCEVWTCSASGPGICSHRSQTRAAISQPPVSNLRGFCESLSLPSPLMRPLSQQFQHGLFFG